MSERASERWTEFDRNRYAETGPHRPDGMRFDGLVMIKDDAGHESVDWFYTRLIGGFENKRVTHWRHVQKKDIARLLRIEAAARAFLTASQAMDDAYHDSPDGVTPEPICDAYLAAKSALRAELEQK